MFLLARAWGLGILGTLVRGSGLSILRVPCRLAALPGHGRGDLDAVAAFWRPTGLFATRGSRAAGWLAVVVALVILGGHIQTSAHVLLAGGLYAAARSWASEERSSVTPARCRRCLCFLARYRLLSPREREPVTDRHAAPGKRASLTCLPVTPALSQGRGSQ